MYFVIKALVLVSAMLAASIMGARRLKRTRKQIELDSTAIREWAGARGWRIEESFEWSEQVSVMAALLAEQGQRGIGTIVVGQNAAGNIIVVETWRDDDPEPSDGQRYTQVEVGPSVAISYPVSSADSPTMLRLTGGGVRAATGEAAPTPAQSEALAGLPVDSRLRVMSDRVLIRVPNYFSGQLADDLLQRAAKLEAGKGPFR